MPVAPQLLDNVDTAVDTILERLGPDIRIGMPLGLGKPIQLINALYQRAKADPSLQLRILTALSLEKPKPGSELEARFLQPFIDRVFDDCPELEYMQDLRAGRLPANVQVLEFFFKPGSSLGNAHAQQHYISSNYTHAARDVFSQGCNVAAQMVAKREVDGETRYSLSCNPDTSPELVRMLRAAQAAGERDCLVIGQVNDRLPYMAHDAEVTADTFDLIIDRPDYHTTLFSTPKMPVTTPDYAIGLAAAALIKDGGTLQVGIGALGDAIVHAAQLRHREPDRFRQVLDELGLLASHGPLIEQTGGTGAFKQGLYGATEMFVDGFLHLIDSGILKRKVYDFTELQRLLNAGRVTEEISPELLDLLEEEGERVIRTHEFEALQFHGVFNDDCRYELGHIIAPDGERIMANLAIPESRERLKAKCLGSRLRNGYVLHGGFFLGPRSFYDALNAMSESQRREICMTGVEKVNQLDLNPALYKEQRIHARFINTGLMVTLGGAVVSDGLEDGRVLSGVGGQYNFVALAHHLLTGRSILMIRAVREADGQARSNVVFSYGHITIPRHLRDIVITEYGIADLRGKTDSEVAKALINIADSRFQAALLEQAKAAGKIEAGYEIPSAHRDNRPERLAAVIARHSDDQRFCPFPFGTDLTQMEQVLGKALKTVKARAEQLPKWRLLWRALQPPAASPGMAPYLQRMGLEQASSLQDRAVRALLIEALQNAAVD